MSERWIGPTGQIGDALAYLEAQFKREWEYAFKVFQRDTRARPEMHQKLLREEERVYRQDSPTPAMEAAVKAIESIKKVKINREG